MTEITNLSGAQQTQAQPQPQPQPQPVIAPAPTEQPAPTPTAPVDALLACLFFVMGFLFWEWQILQQNQAGLGVTLYFAVLLAITFVYLRHKGVRQSKLSLLFLGASVLGALPFVLNGPRDVNLALLLFECCVCLLWVAFSCGIAVSGRLSGFLAWDMINQALIVPFANYGRAFVSIVETLRHSKQDGRRAGATIAYALLGILIAAPVLVLAFVLLVNSDDVALAFARNTLTHIHLGLFGTYALEFIFGIPVGCYLFGAVYGAVRRRRAETLTRESLETVAHKAQRLPRAALFAPLCCFAALYLIYFCAMGPYLFSALSGKLPAGYTYAQYARHGFFELCAVAFINLLILGFTWLFARRKPAEFPAALRALTGFLTLLSCLLIVTALSKMALYINSYGLSPLRVYTFWFMILLMTVFLIIGIWHLKPFNAGCPLILAALAFILVLGLLNTNGIIASYNVNCYLSGQTRTVDIELLTRLSDAAQPALRNLRDHAHDPAVRAQAQLAVAAHQSQKARDTKDAGARRAWLSWNLQRLR